MFSIPLPADFWDRRPVVTRVTPRMRVAGRLLLDRRRPPGSHNCGPQRAVGSLPVRVYFATGVSVVKR